MKVRVAVVGIGAMGKGIVKLLRKEDEDFEVVAVADTNPFAIEAIRPFLASGTLVTGTPLDVLSRRPDVLVDATPTILEAALLATQAIEHKVNIVSMNGEVDQVFGRLLARKAQSSGVIFTSDAGDQHGVLSRTIEDVRRMGFEIVIAGNNKGFLDRYATEETIIDEAAKRRLSRRQCAAYTDGTKLAIEMAILANSYGLSILRPGMSGPQLDNVQQALTTLDLETARKLGGVVDYVQGAEPGGSVFVIAYSDDPEDRFYMRYYKMGEGPYYLFMRPYHLCHYETPFAIRMITEYKKPVLVQRKRVLEVGCRAKTDLAAGTRLEGIGGRHLYGILEKPSALPIGMAEGTTLLKSINRDDPIDFDDVEFPDRDERLSLWEEQTKIET